MKANANEKRREYATQAPAVAVPLSAEERAAKIAELQAEIDALSKPVPVEFPKWKYHPTQGSRVVQDTEAEHALGSGWCNTPADFPTKKEK